MIDVMKFSASVFRFGFFQASIKLIFFAVFFIAFAGSANAQLKKPGNLVWLKMNMKTLSFSWPNTDLIIKLHLGESIDDDISGVSVTKAPIKFSVREATSSFYELWINDGKRRGWMQHGNLAESSYTTKYLKNHESALQDQIKIQYEKTTNQVLITENVSDGSLAYRYILFSKPPRRNSCGQLVGQFDVRYLYPDVNQFLGKRKDYMHLSDVILLPGNRIMVESPKEDAKEASKIRDLKKGSVLFEEPKEAEWKIYALKKVPQSSHPFSLEY